jgi:hexosaminidase
MKKNKIILILFFFITLKVFSQETISNITIIPKPNNITVAKGVFILSSSTKIVASNTNQSFETDWLNEYLNKFYGFKLQVVSSMPKDGNYIMFQSPDWEAGYIENYHLNVNEQSISILSENNGSGKFYALQSLVQLIKLINKSVIIPCVQIKDTPRFQWRGMHLDVCRHFFSISFVKKYIDLLAMHKMNTFHWHLTDDQGWRIEIKKYPKLTSVGAWRKGTMVGQYSDQKFDTIKYGGYYTQEEIKEVVEYAVKRGVTIVPEIEMPGHAVAAIAAYPWLSCAGKNIDVERGWGVFENVFCPTDSTFKFLENVIDEVVSLFPGKYIHIGGDECPKTSWKNSAFCQNLIKTEKLKDEHELQSYFITRMEKYINSKGKQIIGWDEILEGGLAPNASVMSWRGEEGGKEAAKQKHFAVMTPGSHCYFDHYQDIASGEPIAIGGYTPLEKVYSYDPIPDGLTIDEQKYILGAQANLWTEYILNEKHLEYMALPRMCALSEVLWTQKNNKNESDFIYRLQNHFSLLDKFDVNYAKALYRVEQVASSQNSLNQIAITLKANLSLGEVFYTIDGSEPNQNSLKYTSPILIDKTTTIKAALISNGKQFGKTSNQNYFINKATNKNVTLTKQPNSSYKGDGAFTIVNGIVASKPRINQQWIAWQGDDMECLIDLNELTVINEVKCGFLKEEVNWIHLPNDVEVFISNDGKKFNSIGHSKVFNEDRFTSIGLKNTKTRFVKIIAKNHGIIQSGKPGAGSKAWLFCDEIQIN